MKNVLFGAVLLALFSTAATAADVKGTVGASTDYLYHGESVTNGDPTVFGSVKVGNLFVDNLTFSADGVLLNSSPLNSNKSIRSEVGLTYGFDVTPTVSASAGAFRVFNPVTYGSNYNELRVQADWAVADNVTVYGKAANILSDAVPNDTYMAVGVKRTNLFVDKLDVSLQAATLREDVGNNFVFNNFEVAADYNITDKLQAFGMYSVGGTNVDHALRGIASINARGIPSGGMLGLRYNF